MENEVQTAFSFVFQYDKFPYSHGFMALRRHTHARGGCPWRRLSPHRKSSLHPHHIQVQTAALCRQPQAHSLSQWERAKPAAVQNRLPRERGWICCTSEKSSLHISGNIQSERAGCFFTAEKPHRPKSAGTPIPPNQARYAFAAAAHTLNPAHRQDSASPRLSR